MQLHPFLGRVEPDLNAALLGTGYWHFESNYGIDGLFKEEDAGKRLDLLAIIALNSGKGQFRQFIKAAMVHYQTVCVWTVWSEPLKAALTRYGFTPEIEILRNGEAAKGFRWDKKK